MNLMTVFPWAAKKKLAPESLTSELRRAMVPRAKRILLLEDDRNWRDLIAVFSDQYDLEISEAATGSHARQLLTDSGPFDAAIVDIGIVNGDGIQFYRWVKEQFPKLHIVFLTGSSMDSVAQEIHAIGSAPIYSKPMVMTPKFIEDFLMTMGARRRGPMLA